MSDSLVRASGGVVWRLVDGGVEVLLVHRPRYDDWSFPKGKCEPGESDEACAVREVQEETGLRCTLDQELPSTRYVDGKGRDKLVRYWEMAVADRLHWAPGAEVDEQLWLRIDDARRRLSYGRDVEVLDAFARLVGSR